MSILSWYHYLNEDLADPRTKDWILVNSPSILFVLTFSYLYFVLQCGPRYMEKKKAYSLKTVIKIYNVFQIVANALIIKEIFDAGWYEDYFFYCAPIDLTMNPTSMKICRIMWYLLILKLIDYVETGIFVLRKKQRQVSFLHLYHHVSTVIIAWLCVKYNVNGMTMTIPVVNCGIHVIMYSYYLAATFGPTVQRYLNKIKPLITIMQMIQFIVLMLYVAQAFIPGCSDLKFLPGIMLVNLMINFYLFYQFYQEAYVKKNKRS
ncbi:very long chain fatty acid elongase AAEL008004 [Megachile rotundata]|uniref:very long chain fatty acid elongase AAEL008004 n=1 Tax=Megachile rotundata TaxID=143995 RepID=UPI000258E567|nr:PREDICTED: elongation of very long chain fatty acids protein AAEL008004-like [Megachile rotundata]